MTVLVTYGSGKDVRIEISERSTQEVDARAAERGAVAKKTPRYLGVPGEEQEVGIYSPNGVE
jgi:hypothetical protein